MFLPLGPVSKNTWAYKASETGEIKIAFSREIEIQFSKSKTGRLLQDDFAYSESEKQQLASLIEINYKSEADVESQESSQIMEIKVSEATALYIDMQLAHSNPNAVSQDP